MQIRAPFALAALTAVLLSACSGGAPPAPVTSQSPNTTQSERTLGTVNVDNAGASSIMTKVLSAVAYYTPIRGERAPQMRMANPGTHIMTAAQQLSYYGGPYLQSESAYDIYVNCGSASCWGAPGTFLTNLAGSTFIHLLDQYTGTSTNNRYTFAGGLLENYNTSYTLQDQDIYNMVHAAAAAYGGGGYGHIYHVFLENGVRQCSSAAGGCYLQQYCAYHGAVNFSDIGHTLYSVEPYQNVSGCNSPSGKLTDSTNSTLSHEYYETITDPDVQTNVAWYNSSYGEIGDICRNAYGYVNVGGTNFYIQSEWSNRYQACSFSP